MLSAALGVVPTLKRFSISVVPSPCTARDVLAIRVRVAPPWVLLWHWIRIHARSGRPNRLKHRLLLVAFVLAGCIGSVAYLWVRFVNVDLLAPTKAIAPVAATVSASSCGQCNQAVAPAVEHSPPAFASAIGGAKHPEWVRAALLVLGPLTIAGVALFAYGMRRSLCEVFIVGLLPHEPFPVIEQFLARSHDKHVFAIRFLSQSTKDRSFSRFVEAIEGSREDLRLTTLDVTHASVSGVVPIDSNDGRQEYWALVRYGIGLMLEQQGLFRQKALAFTYKLHEWFFIFYFFILGLVVALPSIGWLPKSEDSQFPLLMVGVGVVWAILFLIVHEGLVEHLGSWERMTASKPFWGCPIFRYSERDQPSGKWNELKLEDFEAPIRELGLSAERVVELTLGIMLVIYLTALQIIK